MIKNITVSKDSGVDCALEIRAMVEFTTGITVIVRYASDCGYGVFINKMLYDSETKMLEKWGVTPVKATVEQAEAGDYCQANIKAILRGEK